VDNGVATAGCSGSATKNDYMLQQHVLEIGLDERGFPGAMI
jgi:hypothetical protein